MITNTNKLDKHQLKKLLEYNKIQVVKDHGTYYTITCPNCKEQEAFMNLHETHDSATKFARWRHEKPTTKQRKWLPEQFKGVRKITKGDASAILTYQLQAYNEIQHVLCGAA